MKICFVTIDYPTELGGGGIASYLRTVSQTLHEHGHHVHIVALGARAETRQEGGITVHRVKTPQSHWYLHKLLPVGKEWALPLRELEWSYALWSKTRRVAEAEGLEIIETTEMANCWRRFLADLPPTIVRAHGNSLAIKRAYARPTGAEILDRALELTGMKKIAAITSPGQFSANTIRSETARYGPIPVYVIPNPLDKLFEVAGRNWITSYGDEPPVILYTGRIERRKGTLTLLNAFAQVVQLYPKAKLVIAGDRHVSISEKILAQHTACISPSNLILLGRLSQTELVSWYKRATLFVMPSYYETFGISAIEAMAFGIPVICSSVAGLAEVVEDEKTGMVFRSGDVSALAATIDLLLRRPDLRCQLGQAGKQRVFENFTAHLVSQQTLEVYRKVLA